jgi:hypothetical protein
MSIREKTETADFPVIELLPKDQWLFRRAVDQHGEGCVTSGFLIVNGGIWHFKFSLTDLPNDFIGKDDLERLGIDPIDWRPIGKRPMTSSLV